MASLENERMKSIMAICGIGMAAYFLPAVAVYCALLPFDLYLFEMIKWGNVTGLIASATAVTVKVHWDSVYGKGLFEDSDVPASDRKGWTLDRILVIVIPLLGFSLGVIAVFI